MFPDDAADPVWDDTDRVDLNRLAWFDVLVTAFRGWAREWEL